MKVISQLWIRVSHSFFCLDGNGFRSELYLENEEELFWMEKEPMPAQWNMNIEGTWMFSDGGIDGRKEAAGNSHAS